MKIALLTSLAIGMSPVAFAQLVRDDFETKHTLGSTPVGWDTKWDPNSSNLPLQRDLFTVEAGVGRDGGQGLSLDVSKAKIDYKTKHGSGVSGTTLLLAVDVQIATSGVPLNGDTDPFTPGSELPNGVNDPIIGPVVSPNPLWENGPNFTFSFCRRADNHWGLRVPPPEFVVGFQNNSDLGLEPGLTPSTSDWFTMIMRLTDTGAHWEAFAEVYAEGSPTPVHTSPTYQLPAAFVSGAPIYGGLTTGFGEDLPIGETSKLTSLTFDNFTFGPPTLKITSLTGEDRVGYRFTSVVGKTHLLQYSMDGIHYFDTGVSVVGDGAEHTLIDPAEDTTGRTYRVTSS